MRRNVIVALTRNNLRCLAEYIQIAGVNREQLRLACRMVLCAGEIMNNGAPRHSRDISWKVIWDPMVKAIEPTSVLWIEFLIKSPNGITDNSPAHYL